MNAAAGAGVFEIGEGAVRAGRPGILFVIIHGTASRTARWIRPDSRIRRRLERHFGRRGKTISFEWTGANTDAARLTAGTELGRRILELDGEFGAPIYLVAHSHGGNIAMYAMRDPAVEAKVAGVICLATSFVRCSARPFIPALRKCLGLAPRVVGGTLLGAVAVGQGAGLPGAARAPAWWAFGAVAVIAAARKLWMPFYERACGRLAERLQPRVAGRSEAILAALSLPRLPEVKMLCLASPNDEVGKCLQLSLFFSEMPFYAWRCLGALSDFVMGREKACSRILRIGFYIGIAGAVAGMLAGPRMAALHWVALLALPRFVGLALLFAGAPFLLLVQVLLAVTPDLPGVLAHHFGGERRFDGWFTRFTVHPAPDGPVDCIVKRMNVASGRPNFRAQTLRSFMAFTAHTRLYQDRGVLRELLRWISRAEERRTAASRNFDL